MKDLPVFIDFQGGFSDWTGEKLLDPDPGSISLRETLFYLKEYDYGKIIDLLRLAIVHSEESPQCLFRDYDDNDYSQPRWTARSLLLQALHPPAGAILSWF